MITIALILFYLAVGAGVAVAGHDNHAGHPGDDPIVNAAIYAGIVILWPFVFVFHGVRTLIGNFLKNRP